MRDLFDSELQRSGELLVAMADKSRVALEDATRALLTADLSLAEQVIDRDPDLDVLHREVDELGLETIARQQPVATDLRVIITSLRMGSTLERMGDLAAHIAKIARRRYPHHAVPVSMRDLFTEMGTIGAGLARDCARVIGTRDLELAAQMPLTDDRLDDLHRQAFATMLGPDWDEPTRTAIDCTLSSRFFERFGDHAVSVSGRVHFLVTGEVEEAAAGTLSRRDHPLP